MSVHLSDSVSAPYETSEDDVLEGSGVLVETGLRGGVGQTEGGRQSEMGAA